MTLIERLRKHPLAHRAELLQILVADLRAALAEEQLDPTNAIRAEHELADLNARLERREQERQTEPRPIV